MSNLIRQYKIWKLNKVDDKISEISKFIDNKLKDLIEFKIDNNTFKKKFRSEANLNIIFYMNSNDECILEYSIDNEIIYVKYKGFIEFLEDEYLLEEDDILLFIHYKLNKIDFEYLNEIETEYSMYTEQIEEQYIKSKNN